jgi:hypothetical protein
MGVVCWREVASEAHERCRRLPFSHDARSRSPKLSHEAGTGGFSGVRIPLARLRGVR